MLQNFRQCPPSTGGFSVFAGVGERTREGNDLYKEMTESVSLLVNCTSSAGVACQLLHGCIMLCNVKGICTPIRWNARAAMFLMQLSHTRYAWYKVTYVDDVQGVIKLGDKASESKCTLVYGQMNEPPGARARVALTGLVSECPDQMCCIACNTIISLASVSAGLTVAEHFRDVEGQDVLLFIDNIFRFTQVIFAMVLFIVSQPCELSMEQAFSFFFS